MKYVLRIYALLLLAALIGIVVFGEPKEEVPESEVKSDIPVEQPRPLIFPAQ